MMTVIFPMAIMKVIEVMAVLMMAVAVALVEQCEAEGDG